MHVHIEEQIAKLHACAATCTIRPWSLIGKMCHVPNKCKHLFNANLYRVDEIECL